MPIASCPVTGVQGSEPGSVFFTCSLQVFIDIDNTNPESFLLRTYESQFSQPSVNGEMLLFLNDLHGPSLKSLPYTHVCLVLRSPELTQYFRGGNSSAEEKEHLPHPTGKTLLIENQDIDSLLCHKCVSLAHVMRAPQAAVHLSVSQHVWVYVIVPRQVQGFTLLAELPNVSVS